MRSHLICFYFLLLPIITSCEKEVMKVPDTGRKIVINGLITSDSLLSVNISSSLYIVDSSLVEEKLLKNVQAYIYEKGNCIDSLKYYHVININLGADIYVPVNHKSGKIYPLANHDYEIVVKSPNLPEVKSTTHIPTLVEIDKVDTTVVKLTGVLENWKSNIRVICNIEFRDPVKEKNYYLLYIYRIPNVIIGINNIPFSCNDPIVEEKLNHGSMMEGIVFSDKTINGQKHSLKIILDGKDIGKPFYSGLEFSETNKKIIYFRLYSITEEYFKYIQTLNLFLKNYKNPLAEPTQVYSNIEGGYGIFAGASVSSDSLVFNY